MKNLCNVSNRPIICFVNKVFIVSSLCIGKVGIQE